MEGWRQEKAPRLLFLQTIVLLPQALFPSLHS